MEYQAHMPSNATVAIYKPLSIKWISVNLHIVVRLKNDLFNKLNAQNVCSFETSSNVLTMYCVLFQELQRRQY